MLESDDFLPGCFLSTCSVNFFFATRFAMQVRLGLILQDLVFKTITPATDYYNMSVIEEHEINANDHYSRLSTKYLLN